MYLDAKKFILSFHWCAEVEDAYFGFGIGGVIAIFLLKIIPKDISTDKYLWVIVGGMPPVYLDTFNTNNCYKALYGYLELLKEWIEAVKSGSSLKDLIEINVPATMEWAMLLQNRITFIEDNILKYYQK